MPIRHIMADLRAGKYRPVYLLQGEEPFYIDRISEYIEQHALTEDERSFNQTVLYGLDTDIATIVSEAKRFPMMAQRQVVVVKEAQSIRNLLPNSDEQRSELVAYIENPQPTTVLVICHKYKKVDTRKKVGKDLLKAVEQNGVLFTSEKVKDHQLDNWITDFVKASGYHIDPRTANLLAEYLGNDLSKIDNELGKLFIDMQAGGTISMDLVEKKIGISKDYNIFEFQNALLNKDIQRANRIAIHFGKNQKEHPIQMLVPTLFGFFFRIMLAQNLIKRQKGAELAKELKVSPYFLKDYELGARVFSEPKLRRIIEYLREVDAKSKGIDNHSTEADDLLKELVFKITH